MAEALKATQGIESTWPTHFLFWLALAFHLTFCQSFTLNEMSMTVKFSRILREIFRYYHISRIRFCTWKIYWSPKQCTASPRFHPNNVNVKKMKYKERKKKQPPNKIKLCRYFCFLNLFINKFLYTIHLYKTNVKVVQCIFRMAKTKLLEHFFFKV